MTCLPPSQRHKSGSAPVVADPSLGIRSVLLIIKLPDSTNNKAIGCSSQAGTGASGFGHTRQQSAGAGVGRSVSQAHSGHRCAAVPVLQRRPAACSADAGRAKATAHGQPHGAAAGTRPALRGHARIGGCAFTARSGGPGWAAGAASAKRLAAPCESLRSRALRSENCPPACAGAALACQRRGHQPIICSVSRA